MTTFDFSGLTPLQSAVLGRGGWSLASLPNPQLDKRTVAKPIERGLVVREEQRDGAGPFFVATYKLAEGVRVAWGAYRQTMRERAKERGRAHGIQLWRTPDLEWGLGPRGDVDWCGFGPDGRDRALTEAEACS